MANRSGARVANFVGLKSFLLLDEAVAYRAVFVTHPGRTGRTGGDAFEASSVRDRPYVSMGI